MTTSVEADQWAVAVVAHGMLAVGRRLRTREAAIEDARSAPTLTLTMAEHPDTGGPVTLTGVSPVVFYDQEYGWTFAENNWAFTDVRIAR